MTNLNSIAFLSPTTTYRLMHGLEGQYPADAALCKAAALFYDKVYVNVDKGPRSDFLGALADRDATKLRNSVSSVFQPLAQLTPAPEPKTIRAAIDSGSLNWEFVRKNIQTMDTNVHVSTPFRDKNDPLDGDINPLLSIEIMLIYGITEFDTFDRAKKLREAFRSRDVVSAEDTISIVIPDYSKLSWEDIIEIRAHPNWKDLQHLMDTVKSPNELAEHVSQAWIKLGLAFIEGQETALYRAVSHIPIGAIPIPNPIGVLRDVSGWRQQRNLNAELPWMHTIALAHRQIQNAE